MAATRSGWKHRANCRFAQEDTRNAQRFTYCPSSSSSKESDSTSSGFDHLISDGITYNSNPELTPNSRWWLNLEPNLGPQKAFTREPQKVLEDELEVLNSGYVNKTAIISDYYQCKEVFSTESEIEKSVNSFVEQACKVSVPCKNDQIKRMQELKSETGDGPLLPKKRDEGEFWYPDDHLMSLDSLKSFGSEQHNKLSIDLDSQWVGTEKTEPWWRSAGKDELASLVAQKSLENVENCDLPRPQIKHRGMAAAYTKHLDPKSSLDQMAEMGFSNIDACTRESFTSGPSAYDSDSPLSHNNDSGTTNQKDQEDEQTKAQLMEALCHSQTRARKAEKAAQEAYTEKEHIVSLFFKQASQLFAYKQWLQLLQIENYCLQLHNKDQTIPSLFPECLPWSSSKGRNVKKKGQRKAGKKNGRPRYDLSKGAIAFALGIGLASAGLLLGWTMGFLFPTA